MYPRPLTCINRNMCTGTCFKPPRQPAQVPRGFEEPLIKDYDYYPRYCDRPKMNYLESFLPFMMRPKHRKPEVNSVQQSPRDKWIRCEFEGDEEVTTNEVPLNVNLGPGDYSDKNLQLTLNLKLVPRGPEKESGSTFCKYLRKKRRRFKNVSIFQSHYLAYRTYSLIRKCYDPHKDQRWFKDMLACFSMRRRCDDNSGMGLRDLMARMVCALDDIRTALRDMKKGQDDFVDGVCPSKAMESSSSVKESKVKEPRKDTGKSIADKCNITECDDSLPKRNWSNIVKNESGSEIESTKSTQTFNEAHDRRTNHDENYADSRQHRNNNSLKQGIDNSSSYNLKSNRKHGGSNHSTNSGSESSFRQKNLNENLSEKSASSDYDYDDSNYPNNPTINFALTNFGNRTKKDKSRHSSIASKIDVLAEATSRLQELVSIPVTRNTLNEASASIKDILNLTNEIYEDKSDAASNRDNTNTNRNIQGETIQAKLNSNVFRKGNPKVVEDLPFSINQNVVGCMAQPLKNTSTYTSVANLSLFPGQKEPAPPQTNSVPRSRNKRRKMNKMNNKLPSSDRKSSARRSNLGAGPSSARNKMNNGSSTEATTSSDQVRKQKNKTLSLNRNRTRPISPILQEPSSFSTTLTSSNKSSSTDEIGAKKNCLKARVIREDQGLPGSSRSEDNDNRWSRRRKFTATRRDVSDKSYPRLSGAGSGPMRFRHSAMSDPADELLRAMLERATK